MGIRGELWTSQVTLDNRAYFFNVKENRNGDVFLQIVESKKTDGEGERRAIVIFQEDAQQFLKGLDDSLSFMEKEQRERKRAKAEKKAAKEEIYAKDSEGFAPAKKVYRRKGESRLVAERRANREQEKIGSKEVKGRLHVVSKRSQEEN